MKRERMGAGSAGYGAKHVHWVMANAKWGRASGKELVEDSFETKICHWCEMVSLPCFMMLHIAHAAFAGDRAAKSFRFFQLHVDSLGLCNLTAARNGGRDDPLPGENPWVCQKLGVWRGNLLQQGGVRC